MINLISPHEWTFGSFPIFCYYKCHSNIQHIVPTCKMTVYVSCCIYKYVHRIHTPWWTAESKGTWSLCQIALCGCFVYSLSSQQSVGTWDW